MGQGSGALAPLIVHVDLDSFFVAVERARRPELAGRPVIVGGRPGSRGRVAAASREARKCGIRVGMTLEQASERCPDGEFIGGAFDSYFAASLRIDDILTGHSRDVEWLSIDEVVVALPTLAVVERVQRAVHDLGFDAACGVAGSKLVARIAAQLARPRGLVHVLDGYEARFLSPLKLEMLPGLDPAVARRLRAHGVRRVGQIARMPETSLTALCGRSAAVLARQAAGIDRARIRRTALPWKSRRAATLFDAAIRNGAR